jgi:predicted ABC-type ATPase
MGGVDRPLGHGDDGDWIPDEQLLEHAESVAPAPEPREPRTRQEHAEYVPPPEEGPEPPRYQADQPPSASADQPHSAASVDRADQEEVLPPESSNELAAESDLPGDPGGDQPTGGPHETPGQEAPPDQGQSESSPNTPEEEASKPHRGASSPEDLRPLTDGEWAEHVAEVCDGLDKAHKAGLISKRLHTINGAGEVWTDERERQHDAIIDDLYARAVDIPCDFKAIITGGLGGAGKTTVLTEHAGIDLAQYLVINPDHVKEEMARRGMIPEIEGLTPMEASDLVHEECSHVAKRLARRAETEGKNMIWDITMSSEDSAADRMSALRSAGYTHVDGIFVEIPIETSIRRTDSRHREGQEQYRAGNGMGGRLVPREVIEAQFDEQWGSQNRKAYEAMKGRFDNWSIYDNSVDGRSPVLIESSRHDAPTMRYQEKPHG